MLLTMASCYTLIRSAKTAQTYYYMSNDYSNDKMLHDSNDSLLVGM